MIELKKVSKSFTKGGKTISILKDLDFSLIKGESVAILGPSGSGKSTLLSILGGVLLPDSGEVIINGTLINNLNEGKRSDFRINNLGFIFQDFRLLPHFNALENIAFAKEYLSGKNEMSASKELLKRVGLEDRGNHFPHELSGGECQRVAIARALINQPKIILADEPTGNLDNHTGEKIINLFFNEVSSSDTNLIMVTHSRELAERCDRILELKDGKLLA